VNNSAAEILFNKLMEIKRGEVATGIKKQRRMVKRKRLMWRPCEWRMTRAQGAGHAAKTDVWLSQFNVGQVEKPSCQVLFVNFIGGSLLNFYFFLFCFFLLFINIWKSFCIILIANSFVTLLSSYEML
jgi:hypothetical protein